MMSIRTLLKGEEAAAEALRRAKFKFPGRQVRSSPLAPGPFPRTFGILLSVPFFPVSFFPLKRMHAPAVRRQRSAGGPGAYGVRAGGLGGGCQLVYVSRNWGFTPFPKDVFQEGRTGTIEWRGPVPPPNPLSLGRGLDGRACQCAAPDFRRVRLTLSFGFRVGRLRAPSSTLTSLHVSGIPYYCCTSDTLLLYTGKAGTIVADGVGTKFITGKVRQKLPPALAHCRPPPPALALAPRRDERSRADVELVQALLCHPKQWPNSRGGRGCGCRSTASTTSRRATARSAPTTPCASTGASAPPSPTSRPSRSESTPLPPRRRVQGGDGGPAAACARCGEGGSLRSRRMWCAAASNVAAGILCVCVCVCRGLVGSVPPRWPI